MELENVVIDLSTRKIIQKVFNPSNDVVKKDKEKQRDIVIIDGQEQ